MLNNVSQWQHDECRCVGRFSPKYANEPVISGVTWHKFAKFSHDVSISSPLLKRTFRQWYCNSFTRNSEKNASGISPRSWHFPKISWLSWQRPLTYRKTMYRSIICTQSAFIWWKDHKNRSSISWDIRIIMPVFCHVVQKVHKWAPFSPDFTGPKFTKFLLNIEASFICC